MTTSNKQAILPLLFLVLGAPALALAGEPTDQIKQTTDQLLAIVQTPSLQGPEKEIERKKKMRSVVDERFDWGAMARSAVGKFWHNFSEAQRTEFTKLFSDLVEKTYMTEVDSYSGEKILYKGDKVDGQYGVVESVVVTLKGTDVPVSYRVLKKRAAWLVYDINIEGVSLVNNYRSQIGSILNSSTYDKLISRIKAKIEAKPSESATEKKQGTATKKTKEETL